MFFTSFTFIVFLCLAVVGYYTIFKKIQWQFLLVASFIFYAFSGWQNLLYICVTILSTYFVGRKLNTLLAQQKAYLATHTPELDREQSRSYKATIKSRRRRWLILCLVFNFGILATIKYIDFAILNVNNLLQLFDAPQRLGFWGLLLPMGISFYTFQTMGYIIDVYRSKDETAAENNLGKFALFVSFFPQLIQGPISRFSDLKMSLFSKHTFEQPSFSAGLIRVLWGFFKKMVVADRLLISVKTLSVYSDTYQGIYVIAAVFFYAITLYADFTGGIDITIGIAQMLGIKVAENFNRPFYANSIADYWRRWHITMGTWFRDYLFYPMSVSTPMLKLQKKTRAKLGDKIGKRTSVYLCTIILWLATGLWHGASWNFVVWGLVNGVIILLSQELSPLYAKFHAKVPIKNNIVYRAFTIFRTFWLMSFIRSFDIYAGVGHTFRMLGSIVTNFNLNAFTRMGLSGLGLATADYIVVAVGVAVMVLVGAILKRRDAGKPLSTPLRYTIYFVLIFIILVFGMYGIGFDANQFIYNQF